MAEIGAYEAKTHLSELLDRVSRGERITITRYGTPVALLVPPDPRARGDRSDVAREIRAFRHRWASRTGGATSDEIRSLVEEGRG
jgi:prevent-host-death family protein